MSTYNAFDLATKTLVSDDQATILAGTLDLSSAGAYNVAAATGDVLVPLKIPAGLKISAVFANVRTAFGATAPSSIGFAHIDGSTTVTASPEQAITATGDTSMASTGMKTLLPRIGAFTIGKDSYLTVTFGTVGTGAKGIVDFVVIGEFLGVK